MPMRMVESWSFYFLMTASRNWATTATTKEEQERKMEETVVPSYSRPVVESRSRNQTRGEEGDDMVDEECFCCSGLDNSFCV